MRRRVPVACAYTLRSYALSELSNAKSAATRIFAGAASTFSEQWLCCALMTLLAVMSKCR